MARRVAKLNPTKHHKGIAADNEERYSTHKDPQRLLCSSYTCGLLFALCPINGPCHDQAQILQPLLEPWLSDRMKSQFLLEAFCALPQASLQKYVLPGDVKTFLVVARVAWPFFVIIPASCRPLISFSCPGSCRRRTSTIDWCTIRQMTSHGRSNCFIEDPL